MQNQLAVRENQTLAAGPSASEFEVMKEQATMLLKSGFLPQSIKSPEQAIAIILTGREIGIGTMQALYNINVIQGKPTISPQLMLALIGRSGQLEDLRIDPKSSPDGKTHQVAVTMKRKGRSQHTEIFGTNEAQALGLLSKDNYRKQPLTMMKWRAVAACARVFFPDIILGFYSPEEMGADVAVTDTEDLTLLPADEPRTNTVVRMPRPAEPVYEAEPVEDAVPQTRTEELARQREASPVSPESKGRLLAEGGHVKKSARGYEIADPALGEYYEVLKQGGVVFCNCDDYQEQARYVDKYRCAHVWAVVFHAQVTQIAA